MHLYYIQEAKLNVTGGWSQSTNKICPFVSLLLVIFMSKIQIWLYILQIIYNMYLCPSIGISLLDFTQPDLTFLIHGKVCLNIDGKGCRKWIKQNCHTYEGHRRRTWKVDGRWCQGKYDDERLKKLDVDNQCVRGQKITVNSKKFFTV